MKTIALRCKVCGEVYPPEPLYICEQCFGPLEAFVTPEETGERLRRRIQQGPPSLWRYQDFLPVARPLAGPHTGWTPLRKAQRLGEILGLRNLYLKDDSVNHPSLSFKDRVVSVALTKAVEFGMTTVACASTGNLANAVAAHAASLGLRAVVFIPADLESQKRIGMGVFGPTVVAIRGNYDQVNRLCAEIADDLGWGFVNVNLRPYYAEGSKTLAFEVAEQLGWRAPDAVVVPVASGALYTKIWKGFQEFRKAGLISDTLPRMYGAQAAGCAPVAQAWREGKTTVHPVKPDTIAKSIAIGNPADGIFALQVARESGGAFEAVTDEEIVDAIRLLAETEGIFTETAGGVTIAVLRKLAAQGAFRPEETVVAYITGNGYKTLDVVAPHIADPVVIAPNLREFREKVLPQLTPTPALA